MRGLGTLLGEAVRHHRAGQLAEAERCYRQVLVIDAQHADSLHLLGIIADQTGRHGEAIDLIGQAIRLRDDVPSYHNNLGNVLMGQGKLADAVTHYERALALKPDYAEFYTNLGTALLGQDNLVYAMACYERALALKPDCAEAHYNLGYVFMGQGKLTDAVARYECAIALKPDYIKAHYNLGNVFMGLGKLADALMHYERALALKPNLAEAHNNLGSVLMGLGSVADAVMHYECALALKSDYIKAHYNLGNAFVVQGKLANAVTHYECALALKPDYVEAYYNLGTALLRQGKLKEAEHAYEKAIDLAPKSGRYYRALLHMRPVASEDRYLGAIEKLAQDMSSLPMADQIELHFALSKAYVDLEQYERSFRHLLEGNALKRRELVYDEPEALNFFDRIRAVLTLDVMNGKRGFGNPSPIPIFIVGMPRSGTTLIEQILASHPKIFGAGELPNFSNTVASLNTPNSAPPSFPEVVPALSVEKLHELGTSYLDAVGAVAPGAARITNKMPGNFACIGLIHLALPNARIIHMRRNPIDTCLSCFSILFANGQPYSYDLGELGRYYRAYDALMEHWRQVLPGGVMLEVQYEDVVADVEQQARRVVAYCGLEWDDTCLAFHETQRSVRTASAIQVRQPIYRTSVGRWQRYKNLLQPLIKELGLGE